MRTLRLIRLLGHGGMASVYPCELADGEIQQQAAVKFLHCQSEPPPQPIPYRNARSSHP